MIEAQGGQEPVREFGLVWLGLSVRRGRSHDGMHGWHPVTWCWPSLPAWRRADRPDRQTDRQYCETFDGFSTATLHRPLARLLLLSFFRSALCRSAELMSVCVCLRVDWMEVLCIPCLCVW